jgi:hypothetical protein
MELLDKYNALRAEVLAYFGYVENWRVLALDDAREYFWRLHGEGPGVVRFAKTEQDLEIEDGHCFENEIYTQAHLTKWVFRGAEYTMVAVDPHTDGNQFLQVFTNANERSDHQRITHQGEK